MKTVELRDKGMIKKLKQNICLREMNPPSISLSFSEKSHEEAAARRAIWQIQPHHKAQLQLLGVGTELHCLPATTECPKFRQTRPERHKVPQAQHSAGGNRHWNSPRDISEYRCIVDPQVQSLSSQLASAAAAAAASPPPSSTSLSSSSSPTCNSYPRTIALAPSVTDVVIAMDISLIYDVH